MRRIQRITSQAVKRYRANGWVEWLEGHDDHSAEQASDAFDVADALDAVARQAKAAAAWLRLEVVCGKNNEPKETK